MPEIPAYICKRMRESGMLGFDGCVVSTRLVHDIMEELKGKDITISAQKDLVGIIWKDRLPLPTKRGFFLEEAYNEESTRDKLADIRTVMQEQNATHHIVTSLDGIAWMMNMRGRDINCFPVMLCYLVITRDENHIFIDKNKLDGQMLASFREDAVAVHAYDDIYAFMKTIPADVCVMLNTGVVNYVVTQSLRKKIRIIDRLNPSQLMEARKSEIEPENNRRAHIRDAVAVTKFMYWLKSNIGKGTIIEISASDYLKSLRRKQEHNLRLSFSAISVYKRHAAMIHYDASEETDVELKPERMLLVDSGGQYLEGATDIIRAFVPGPISNEIHTRYTYTLRDMIQSNRAKFLEGCRGMSLDILIRGPL